MKNGFFRVAACVPPVVVADPQANAEGIIDMARQVDELGVELAVFPELCVTGYTCGDLFHNSTLLAASHRAIDKIAEATSDLDVALIVGAPEMSSSRLYNCALVIYKGAVKCRVAKTYIPNYNEFYERRMFTHGLSDDDDSTVFDVPATNRLFNLNGVTIGIEICEDLWTTIPPSCHAALAGATVIANLSASPDSVGKYNYLKSLVAQQSGRCKCAYIYASAGFGESSTDLVFDGKAMIAECGYMLACNKRWQHGPQFVVQDVDIDAISHERVQAGTFTDCARRENGFAYRIDAANGIDLSSILNCDSPDQLNEQIQRLKERANAPRRGPALIRAVEPHPFVPADDAELDRRAEEVINIQV
ncbi:MAG: NAD(+) synthase, partial [Muribaculaceae bacterium]|nr:NAD(+) synthase [Muribaculaceae bacterium]